MSVHARLISLPTKSYVWVSLALTVTGWTLDAIKGSLWDHCGIHGRQALDYLCGGIFWLGFSGLMLLVPVAAFRPDNRFYLKGDCKLRAKRVGFVLGALLAVFILIITYMAFEIGVVGFNV